LSGKNLSTESPNADSEMCVRAVVPFSRASNWRKAGKCIKREKIEEKHHKFTSK
jgi:hypothetical protein